ncbi:MAG: ATP synthase F1 subunit gamma [Acidobacteriota bacterium]
MPNLRDIRRRIRSVQSTQQITKAMKMVAAAKLRRSQERMMSARPYANKMLEVLNSLAARTDQTAHPLLTMREEGRVRIVVLTGDRGLCGAFNTNILRYTLKHASELQAEGKAVVVDCIGRKGRDFFKRRSFEMGGQWVGRFAKVSYDDAEEISRELTEKFVGGECDAVYLIYNHFKSVITQKIVVERLLPIPRMEVESEEPLVDYLYEPTPKELFGTLLPKHVGFQVFRAMLESGAAEHAARMTAMESATNNARDMIDRLTLYANRVRQAAITKEIIEVVSGAQALG